MDHPIRPFVKQVVAELLGVEANSVSEEIRFRDQGLTSAQALSLVSRLCEGLGKSIPAAAIWEHPSVTALSAYLTSLIVPPSSSLRSIEATPIRTGVCDPVAIVGIGCRFPEGIHDPSALWDALVRGADTIREVPAARWDLNAWFDDDSRTPGKMSTRFGGFVEDVAGFDAGFFRISPKEAAQMDPQQRLALEVAWEALEDAAIVPGTLEGSRTGLFMGAMWQEYGRLASNEDISPHSATGWDNSIIPARIAYMLGVHGPVMTVNTACSSSLVAVHLAVQSLRRGESELAIAGGVSLMLTPHATVQMTKFGAMNPAGRCRAFDADANGYVRGEGCGVVVLKRLSSALANGDRIYAVIAGTGVNSDGASNGLTAPNPTAQAAVLRSAWHDAGVPLQNVSYVETHGPGTLLGDPIEAAGLGAAFAPERDEALRIGSVKTNFGHLEAASGMAGLLKTALSLHHGALPASLHFDTPNPHIDFDRLRLRVVDRLQGFPLVPQRYAGTSSFGFGGTNAHIALSEAPGRPLRIAALAGDTPAEVRKRAKQLIGELVELETDEALDEVATRMHGEGSHRVTVRGRHPADLEHQLRAVVQGRAPIACVGTTRPKSVFAFGGQGGQWSGMAQDLLARDPAFQRAIARCDRAISKLAGWSVRDALALPAGVENPFHRSEEHIQPLLFAVQVALAETLMHWGLTPDAVVGQSMGEVAAAVVCGALSIEDGAAVIVSRSRLVTNADGRGSMAVVELSAEQAEAFLSEYPHVSIAVYMSPRHTVLSGTGVALDAVRAALEASGVRVQRVAVEFASHSNQMDPLLPELARELATLQPRSPRIPMWSTVRNAWVATDELLDAKYWCDNLRRPVRLQQATEALFDEGLSTFVEVGPHPVLNRALEATLDGRGQVLASSWRGERSGDGLRELASDCWESGSDVRWERVAGREAVVAASVLPLLISGRDEASLRAQAARWADSLARRPGVPWADVTRVAGVRRTHFPARASIAAVDSAEGIEALRALADRRSHSSLSVGREQSRSGVVFIFSGHGSQWQRMGSRLLEESPAFTETVNECDAALRPHTGWSVRDVLSGVPEGAVPDMNRVDVVQPVLFAMGLGLAAVWRSLGVEPAAVVGHSVGEITAAVACGALSLEDGARIVAVRGRLIGALPRAGGMLHVARPSDEVSGLVRRWADSLCVGVINDARSAVVSGDIDAIADLEARLAHDGIHSSRVNIGFAAHSAHVDEVIDPFRAALAGLTAKSTRIPFYSTVTGGHLEGSLLDADYWCRNIREPVRFASAVDALSADGHAIFCELSGHPVLTTAVGAVAGDDATVVASLRRDHGDLRSVVRNLAELHLAGFSVDWEAVAGPGSMARLPTYAFQRQRYWLPRVVSRGNVRTAGLRPIGHPLLGSMTTLAGTDRALFSGRISVSEQTWFADHSVLGTVVVPGTAILELALSSARELGCSGVSELTLEAPLALPEKTAIRLQVQVDSANDDGLRPFVLYGRPEGDEDDHLPWTSHATGALRVDERRSVPIETLEAWSPQGADAVDLTNAYSRLAEWGYEYGESFRCLRAAWKSTTKIFAHVSIPEASADHAGDFEVHPATLDAALHAVLLAGLDLDGTGAIWLPFMWSDVSLHASRVGELRVRFELLSSDGDMRVMSLLATDVRGQPVLSVGALRFRRATSERIRASAHAPTRDLYRLEFHPTTLGDIAARCRVVGGSGVLADLLGARRYSGRADLLASLESETPPAVLVMDLTGDGNERVEASLLPGAVHDSTARVLEDLRVLLMDSRLGATDLVWITRRAVATPEDGPFALDLIAAPIWGLVRSARSEHPERTLRLIDVDELGAGRSVARTLQRLVATVSEPELVLRNEKAFATRLAPMDRVAAEERPNLSGTVLISGGLGELGQSLARHLVERHRVKHLVLTSRRGMETPGSRELVASLEAAGARTVTIAACDVAQREEVASVIDAIPLSRSLCAVFHLAGVLDDGAVTQMTSERLRRALSPKVDGAWNLHEMTRDCPLVAFVMFSSLAGVLGLQGQANYAAGNVFLDALSAERRRQGLPALSVAWGLWEHQGVGMSARLGELEIARISRQGVAPLPVLSGFALLDKVLALSEETSLVPARLDLESLRRALPERASIPAVFRSLAKRAATTVETVVASSLRSQLSSMSEAARDDLLRGVVREEIAKLLGLPAADVRPDALLNAQGFDSLMAVELKHRLSTRFDMLLPTTLVFDYPTSLAIAGLIRERLNLDQSPMWSDSQIRSKLERVSIDSLRSSGVLDAIMVQPDDSAPSSRFSHFAPKADFDIDGAPRDSLLEMMEDILGVDNG